MPAAGAAKKLESALINSATGNVKDLGDFTQYIDDEYVPVQVARLDGGVAALYLTNSGPTWIYEGTEAPAGAQRLYRLARP